jgi:PAS domain S-box-containing protein
LRPGDVRRDEEAPKTFRSPRAATPSGDPERRLRAILESATDYAIVATDGEGRVTEWSAGAEAIFGWEKAEMLGHTLERTLPPEERVAHPYRRELETALLSGNGHTAGWRMRKDGGRFWATCRITPLRGEEGGFEGFLKVVRDETEALRHDQERQRFEAELRAAEGQLRVALDAGRMAVWNYDLETDAVNRSPELYRVLGFDPDGPPPTQEQIQSGYEPGVRESLFAIGREALATEERRFQAEFQYRRPDGTVLWLLLRAEILVCPKRGPTQVVGVLVDITERKHAEDALAEALRTTDEILESIGDAFYALDSDLRFAYVNGRAATLWRKQAADLIGRAFAEVFPDAVGSPQWAMLQEVKRSRIPQRVEAVSPITHTWLDLNIYPAPQGGVSVYFRDITERKHAEAQMRLLVNELNHRVKNTLAVVQSIATQTFRDENGDEAVKSFTGRLIALAKAHDLLTREHWEGAGLKKIIERVVKSVSCPDERCRLTGDDVRLPPSLALAVSMAVHELATNAIKYGALSDDAGAVDIEWRVTPGPQGERVHIEWRESGGPPVRPPTRKGFGTRLLERALAHENGGRAELDYAPEGLRCVMEALLSQPAMTDPAAMKQSATAASAGPAQTAGVTVGHQDVEPPAA